MGLRSNFLLLACLAGAGAAETVVEVGPRERVVEGETTLAAGMIGAFPLADAEAAARTWRLGAVRRIEAAPGATWMAVPDGVETAVETLYDRFVPALTVSDPQGWRAQLAALAAARAAAPRRPGVRYLVEFWNEPYHNWVTKPGVNHDPVHYDGFRALLGGPVHLRGEIAPTEHMVWERGLRAVLESGNGVPLPTEVGRAPKREAGFAWQVGKRHYRWIESYVPVDTTRVGWWPGKQDVLWYRRMLAAFAESMAGADGVAVSGGWGCFPFQERGGLWDDCYAPLIAGLPPTVRDVHEHHYGIDARHMVASYELAAAWADERLAGARLRLHCTETCGQMHLLSTRDPRRLEGGRSGERSERAWGTLHYTLRDIIGMWCWQPDRARTRIAFEPGPGEDLAFRLLRPVRGRLVAWRCDDPGLWVTAARDGATLSVALWNDGWEPRAVRLRLAAPAGTRLAGGWRTFPALATAQTVEPWQPGLPEELRDAIVLEEGTVAAGARRAVALHAEPVPAGADELAFTLPAMGASVVQIALDGAPAPAREQVVRVRAALPVLAPVADGPLRTTVAIDPALATRATRAVLRMAYANRDGARGLSLALGGRPLALPAGQPMAGLGFAVIALDPALLRAGRVEVDIASDGAPIQIASLALELHCPEVP